MGRERNIEMFAETCKIVEDGSYHLGLSVVPLSHTKEELSEAIYYDSDAVAHLIDCPQNPLPYSIGGRCNFHVEDSDTLSAALVEDEEWPSTFRRDRKPVLALNFADSIHPGGMVENGATAQEEDLCRRSTLYASLTSASAAAYYSDNCKMDAGLGSDGILISPCVEVIRDTDGALLEKPVTVAVLTCAAPDLRALDDMAPEELAKIIRHRIDGILHIAYENGYDTLVLGAWGCGVFGNDPDMVAETFAASFREIHGAASGGKGPGPDVNSLFRRVCFAVPTGRSRNHDAFNRVFGDFYHEEDAAEAAKVHARISKREKENDCLDKFQGCLIGGAIGDALGYPVEFMRDAQIRSKYGSKGITSFDLDSKSGLALISDDTQMTLFTAAGVLVGSTRLHMRGIGGWPTEYVRYAYLDWLETQDPSFKKAMKNTWLSYIPELRSRRAPGNTCLSALSSGGQGTIENPINNSKGCGGVMRVAPIGLFVKSRYAPKCAAEVAAITHGHPLGWIPAGCLAYIVSRCADEIPEDCQHRRRMFKRIIDDCCQKLPSWFPGHEEDTSRMADLLQQALELAKCDEWSSKNIRKIGEGWVGEEALAIAVYACMRHMNDFGKAIIVAVNHDGDSDSTGAIAGNIMGAALGLSAIQPEWLEHLELKELILQVAKDLCDDCPMWDLDHYQDEIWLEKYGASCMGTISINGFLRNGGKVG